jgi:hypothetical protein
LGVCQYLRFNGFVRAYDELALTGLCGVIENMNSVFTFFVTSDAAYDSLRTDPAYSFTNTEWADKWNEILGFAIIEGVALSPAELTCPTSSRTTRQGESINTECVDVIARRTALYTEMETKRFQFGDCNDPSDKPEILRWYEAANGNIIELDSPPLPNAFNNCITPSPTKVPTAAPTNAPTKAPTNPPTQVPTVSAYPSSAPVPLRRSMYELY